MPTPSTATSTSTCVPSPTSEERAHFSSPATKAAIAEAQGAIGAIVIARDGGAAFARTTQRWDGTRTTWAKPDGTGDRNGVPVLATLSPAGAAKLFAGTKTPWVEVLKLATDSEAKFAAEPLPGSLAVSIRTSFESGMSSNVVGIIPGSDPKLGKEVVVLSAHLDHLGVGRADETGDTIYNGAEDNAVGIASLIEEAKRFKTSGKPPRRTVMFLAVTAEEKGLVGADYFANHPTVPISTIVADVNLDMPILTFAFEDMTVYGADRSTLGRSCRRRSRRWACIWGRTRTRRRASSSAPTITASCSRACPRCSCGRDRPGRAKPPMSILRRNTITAPRTRHGSRWIGRRASASSA